MDRMGEQPGRKDSATSQNSINIIRSHSRNASSASIHSTTSFESDDVRSDDYDPDLDDKENEAESWNDLVDSNFRRRLNAKETKRQCVIYELIQTETQYVRTLYIMKKIYYDGMKNEMNISGEDLSTLFPMLEEILDLNGSFLRDLKTEQKTGTNSYCVEKVGNIILKHFGGPNGQKFREMYGYFCSHHQEAVALFKEYLKEYKDFQQFNAKCLSNVRARRLSIPECITYISMRLTKYPLLIEAIIKATTQNNSDHEDLKASLGAVKQVLAGMNEYVDAHEKEKQLLKIRKQIDSLSIVKIKDSEGVEQQFKAYKTIPKNAKLVYDLNVKYRCNHKLYETRMVIISTKVIFFQEHPNTKKLQLLEVDNRPPVLSLREVIDSKENNAAADENAVFIITKSVLIEILFDKKKDQREFIATINEICKEIKAKPEVEDEEAEEESTSADTEEDKKRLEEERLRQVKELVAQLRDTDEKIRSQLHFKNELVKRLREFTFDGSSVTENETEVKTIPDEEVFSTRAKLEELLTEVNNVLVGGSSQENTPAGSPNVKRKISGTPSPKTKRRETPKKSATFTEHDNNRRGSNIQMGVRSATLGALVGGGINIADHPPDAEPMPSKLSKQKQLKKLMSSSKSLGSNEDISSSRASSTSSLNFIPPALANVQAYQHLSEQLSSFIEITNQQDLEIAKMQRELSSFKHDRSTMEEEVSSLQERLRVQREESEKQIRQERDRYIKLSNDYKKSRERSVRMTAAHQRHVQADEVVEYQL